MPELEAPANREHHDWRFWVLSATSEHPNLFLAYYYCVWCQHGTVWAVGADE